MRKIEKVANLGELIPKLKYSYDKFGVLLQIEKESLTLCKNADVMYALGLYRQGFIVLRSNIPTGCRLVREMTMVQEGI